MSPPRRRAGLLQALVGLLFCASAAAADTPASAPAPTAEATASVPASVASVPRVAAKASAPLASPPGVAVASSPKPASAARAKAPAATASTAQAAASASASAPTVASGSPKPAASKPADASRSPPAVAAASAAYAGNPCDLLIKRMPNLSSGLCGSAMLQASGATSVNGYPLYQRDVSARFQEVLAPDGAKPPRRPRVLVIGGIHGDELSSTSLVFHWIAHAMETGADMDWRFVPALNPDGLMQATPTRTNARGVDLNRNFPTPRWAQEAPEYWAKRTKKDPRRYPGPTPLSEPETRFLQETMDRWKPDLIVSVHAPYGVLDYDGPSIPPERLGRLFLDRVGIFPGSLGHYGGVHRGVPVVTIELPSAIRTPTNAEMRQMWIDLLRWIGERLSVTER